jgi:hypothetical protein
MLNVFDRGMSQTTPCPINVHSTLWYTLNRKCMPTGHYLLDFELELPHVWLEFIGYFMALVVEGEPSIHKSQELQHKNIVKRSHVLL